MSHERAPGALASSGGAPGPARRVAATPCVRQSAGMKLWTRILAVALAVIGHGFLLALGSADTGALVLAYLISVACLWGAAALLWRRTMDSD